MRFMVHSREQFRCNGLRIRTIHREQISGKSEPKQRGKEGVEMPESEIQSLFPPFRRLK